MPKIQSVKLSDFKRFTNLVIEEIPSSVRLVVLSGPHGQGKSSLFDAFRVWSGRHGNAMVGQDSDYYRRATEQPPQEGDDIKIDFHGNNPAPGSDSAKKAFHFRSAHRNDPQVSGFGFVQPAQPEMHHRFSRMIDNDAVVAQNYRTLISEAVDGVFEQEARETQIGVWRDKVIADLRDPMERLFPGLRLEGLGSPIRDPGFRFSKGLSRRFPFKNLSEGERAAFDLLLDIMVARTHRDDTVYCLDEPETHLNPRIQGSTLREILELIPAKCQLWIATHALGMLREARDVETRCRETVAFLDFGGEYDFDKPTRMCPAKPTRTFWKRALEVALHDMSKLVAPSKVVICEGSPRGDVAGKNAEYDARCYRDWR